VANRTGVPRTAPADRLTQQSPHGSDRSRLVGAENVHRRSCPSQDRSTGTREVPFIHGHGHRVRCLSRLAHRTSRNSGGQRRARLRRLDEEVQLDSNGSHYRYPRESSMSLGVKAPSHPLACDPVRELRESHCSMRLSVEVAVCFGWPRSLCVETCTVRVNTPGDKWALGLPDRTPLGCKRSPRGSDPPVRFHR
jgi:hypothetical protein